MAVRGDLGPFNKDLKGGLGAAEKQAQTFGQKLKGAMTPANLLGAAGIGVGLSQVVSFLGDATNAAAEFQDSVGATGVIFGDEMVPQMEAWGDAAAKNFGASKQEAISAANVIATLGKSAGLVGEDLVDFSQEMVGLGGDLASMFGGSTQDAITAVGAALRGESEPIRRYGVLLDDATLRAKAFEMGIIDSVKNALTPQQKVLAAQASIMEQTKDAQGDFLRTSDGMANTQRELAAELANVNIEIGEKLLPVMLTFATWVKDSGVPAISALVDAFGGIGEGIDDGIEGIARLQDWLNGNLSDVSKVAEGLGISYMEARAVIEVENQRMIDSNGRLGGSAEDTAERVAGGWTPVTEAARDAADAQAETWEAYQAQVLGVTNTTTDAVAKSAGAWESYQNQISTATDATADGMADVNQAIVEGGVGVEREWTRIAKVPASMMAAENAAIRAAAVQHQVEYAKGLLDAMNEPYVQMEALRQMQAEVQSQSAQTSRLMGQLNSQRLADGLADGRPEVRAQAEATRLAIINQLATLGVDASNWGYGIGASLASGLDRGYGLVLNSAGNLAGAVRGQIGINSEPEAADSPLRGITKWGGNIVKTIADGMLGQLGTGSAAAGALAGALVPGFGMPGMAMAGPSVGSGGGGVNNYTVNVAGKEPVVSSAQDIINEMARLERFK